MDLVAGERVARRLRAPVHGEQRAVRACARSRRRSRRTRARRGSRGPRRSTIRSYAPSGNSSGTSRRSNATLGSRARGRGRAPPRRRRSPAGRRRGRASRSVSTPIEQPISSPFANRRPSSAAIVASYFARSYALVSNSQGSGSRGVELVEERGAQSFAHGRIPLARSIRRPEPGHERVEPVLEHEQLEVAAGAVQRRAGRERARAGRARRLVEDRARPRRRPPGASCDRRAVVLRRVLEPAVDRRLRGDDPARAERPQVVGLGLGREVLRAPPRPRSRGSPPSTPRCGSRRG